MKVESESKVAQSCLTLSDPMDCSPPGSSFHGIFWATVLEWGAMTVHGANSFSIFPLFEKKGGKKMKRMCSNFLHPKSLFILKALFNFMQY